MEQETKEVTSTQQPEDKKASYGSGSNKGAKEPAEPKE